MKIDFSNIELKTICNALSEYQEILDKRISKTSEKKVLLYLKI